MVKFLPTQVQQGSSPQEKLSRAVDSGGCSPNLWHHGHKPESSSQPLGRRGFCMTTHGNLGEWSMSRPKLWAHLSLPWEWWTNHYHLSRLGSRCLPCLMTNSYGLRCTFGCIIEINQISDYLQDEQCYFRFGKFVNRFLINRPNVVITIPRISAINNYVNHQRGLRTTPGCIIL